MKRRNFILGLGGAALYSSARGQQTSPIQQQSTSKKRMAQVAPSAKVEELKSHAQTEIYFDELKACGTKAEAVFAWSRGQSGLRFLSIEFRPL